MEIAALDSNTIALVLTVSGSALGLIAAVWRLASKLTRMITRLEAVEVRLISAEGKLSAVADGHLSKTEFMYWIQLLKAKNTGCNPPLYPFSFGDMEHSLSEV